MGAGRDVEEDVVSSVVGVGRVSNTGGVVLCVHQAVSPNIAADRPFPHLIRNQELVAFAIGLVGMPYLDRVRVPVRDDTCIAAESEEDVGGIGFGVLALSAIELISKE